MPNTTVERDAVLKEVAAMLETAAQRLRQLLIRQPSQPQKLNIGFNADGSYNFHFEGEEGAHGW